MARLDDLQFDTAHWKLAASSSRERVWANGIFVPIARFSYTILVECPEYGMTGVREALQACVRWSRRGPQGSEFDAALDRVLPDHPHHRCRVYLNEIVETLSASPALLGADPWQLEIETNDGTLVQRELIGTTTWERAGLREHFTALLSENARTRL